jgi:adenylate cyclase
VIFLRDEAGELMPRALQRRDGTTGPLSVSSTILNHVAKERAAVLTHDAAMDFAASKGKSMILNRISSAIVAPLLDSHQNDVLGVIWLDSETLAQFQPKDLDLVSLGREPRRDVHRDQHPRRRRSRTRSSRASASAACSRRTSPSA